MQEQLNSIETKIMDLHILLNAFMVKQEARVTRLETVQRAFLWIFGLLSTAIVGYSACFPGG